MAPVVVFLTYEIKTKLNFARKTRISVHEMAEEKLETSRILIKIIASIVVPSDLKSQQNRAKLHAPQTWSKLKNSGILSAGY